MKANKHTAAMLTAGLLQRPIGDAEAADQRDGDDATHAVELYRRVLKAMKETKKAHRGVGFTRDRI